MEKDRDTPSFIAEGGREACAYPWSFKLLRRALFPMGLLQKDYLRVQSFQMGEHFLSLNRGIEAC